MNAETYIGTCSACEAEEVFVTEVWEETPEDPAVCAGAYCPACLPAAQQRSQGNLDRWEADFEEERLLEFFGEGECPWCDSRYCTADHPSGCPPLKLTPVIWLS